MIHLRLYCMLVSPARGRPPTSGKDAGGCILVSGG
jgi:hypothetical protein